MPNETISMPPIFKKALNLFEAVKDHIIEGQEEVTPEEYTRRLIVCDGCIYKTKDWKCSHPDCGCYLDIKAKWKEQDCPIKKWPPIEGERKKSSCCN